MGLSGLDNALSGLRATNEQLAVISGNISNVNTPGFSRKVLGQTTQVANGQSVGVVTGNIVRNVDINLERDLWTQISLSSDLNVQKQYLDRIQQFHGPPDAGISLAAEFADFQSEFIALANDPDNGFQQSTVLREAQAIVSRTNDFAALINQSRTDTQNEISTLVGRVNGLTERIAALNAEIAFNTGVGTSTAALSDQRSLAVSELAQYLEIETFLRGDGILSVQVGNGQELIGARARELFFNPPPLAATIAYEPESNLGLFLGGNPNLTNTAVDITADNVGGQIGGLLTLRDETLPEFAAQIDEFAHKLALRFDAQGLRLFSNSAGQIPPDTAPNPPATTVSYVGFAQQIQVNQEVSQDPSLLQRGTYNGNVPTGSSEVIDRILNNAFGEVDFALAANADVATSVDIRAAATGTATLQDWLGLTSQNQIRGNVDLTGAASIADIITAGGADVFGTTDVFEITFDDPDIGSGPYVVSIDLSTIADNPALNAGQELIAAIEADGDWAAIQTDFGATATLNAQGELVLDSRSDLSITAATANGIGAAGLSFLGLSIQSVTATDPSFQIQVGNNAPQTITILPTDTETELLANLNAIEGVAAQIDANGFLSIRPGNDFNNPDFGGDLRLISNNFTTSNATLTGTAAGRTAIGDGVDIVSALFGTYNDATGVQSFSPIQNVLYQSETTTGSGTFEAFRVNNLGSNGTLTTSINSAANLSDFTQQFIAQHSIELNIIEGGVEDAEVLRDLFQNELSNESGVNIDEELSQLILLQTAYAASAQVLQSLEQLFEQLLNAVR